MKNRLAATWFRLRHPRTQRAINRRLGIDEPTSLRHQALIGYRCVILGSLAVQAVR